MIDKKVLEVIDKGNVWLDFIQRHIETADDKERMEILEALLLLAHSIAEATTCKKVSEIEGFPKKKEPVPCVICNNQGCLDCFSDIDRAYNRAREVIGNLPLALPKEELDKEKVEKILESHITHVSLYHDKECGRVTQEQIIFKARFKKTAQAIHDHFTLPKEEEEPSCDFCKEYKRNCVCSLLKEELDKNKMMKVIKENVPRYIRLRKDEMPVGFVYPIPPLNDIRFEDLAKALCQAYSEGLLKKE